MTSNANARKEYLDTIIESHFHVIEIIIKRYLSVNPRYNYLREDMISRGSEVLVLAAHKFDQERGVTFSTYFSNRMRGDIKNIIRDSIKDQERFSYTLSEIDYPAPIREIEYVSEEMFEMLEGILSEEEMKIVEENLTGNVSKKELAEELGVSVTTFKRRKRALIRKLRELLEGEV